MNSTSRLTKENKERSEQAERKGEFNIKDRLVKEKEEQRKTNFSKAHVRIESRVWTAWFLRSEKILRIDKDD